MVTSLVVAVVVAVVVVVARIVPVEVVVIVVVEGMVRAGAVSKISVEVLVIDEWAGVAMINAADAEAIVGSLFETVSCFDVAGDMFVGVLLLSVIIIGVVTGVNVGALARNILAGVMTALDFDISELFKGFRC